MRLFKAHRDMRKDELKKMIESAKWDVNYHTTKLERSLLSVEAFEAKLKQLEDA